MKIDDNKRQLLELAAKAIGKKIEWKLIGQPFAEYESPFIGPAHGWNPLYFNGDAFALAISLKMAFWVSDDGYYVTAEMPSGHTTSVKCDKGQEGAARLAIVTTAARYQQWKMDIPKRLPS